MGQCEGSEACTLPGDNRRSTANDINHNCVSVRDVLCGRRTRPAGLVTYTHETLSDISKTVFVFPYQDQDQPE